MSPKFILKKILHKAGFEIRRLENPVRPPKNLSKTRESGLVLEFVGVSGIGKTTLLKSSLGRLGAGWVTEGEFSHHQFPNGFRFMPNSFGLGEIEASFVCNYVLRKLETDTRLVSLDQKLRHLSQHLDRLRLHLLCEGDFPRGVIMYEGLVMSFGNELMQFKGDSARIRSMLGRRLVVSIECGNHASVLSQIRKRHDEQPGHTGYMGLSDEEIVRSLEQQQKDQARWVQALEPYLGGVLKLDRLDGLDANSNSVVEFVETMVERKQ